MVAKTEFMPFVVTMLTLLSRVRLLLIAQVHEMSDVFTALAQCERVLPGEKSFYPSTQWPQILLEWAGLGYVCGDVYALVSFSLFLPSFWFFSFNLSRW